MQRAVLALTFSAVIGAGLGSSRICRADVSQEAEALAEEAMSDDFLATDFRAALGKLQRAINKCGRTCDKPLRARLLRDLGILYLTGFNNPRAARGNIQAALKLDPELPLPAEFATPEIRKIFLDAGANPATLLHTPTKRQAADTPVPVFAELLGSVPDALVMLYYRKSCASGFTPKRMTLSGDYYTALIPCGTVQDQISVEYYLVVKLGDEAVSSAGSREAPIEVQLPEDLEGEPRSLPGQPPPEKCSRPEAVSLASEAPPPEAKQPRKRAEPKSVYVSFGVQQDLALLGGEDVCTPENQAEGPFYCFRQDGEQYRGQPREGVFNKVESGIGLATTRLLLGIDLRLGDSLSGFGRGGYVLGTGPTPDGVSGSLRLHGELGLKYWLTDSGALPAEGVGVYLSLSGGAGQVDAKQSVSVAERTDVAPTQENPPNQTVDAWAKYGQVFVALGPGLWWALGPGAVMLDVKAMVLFPTTGFALGPGLSYGLGF